MTYADFQADWEREAHAEYEGYLRRPPEALVSDAEYGRYGEYYQLWRAIAARATLDSAGKVLFDVLHRDDPYLIRYHAAQALLSLLGTTELEPVDLSANRPRLAANLERVGEMLRERRPS
jgi:hypothetical protein